MQNYFPENLAIFGPQPDYSLSNNVRVRLFSSARHGLSPEPDLPILSKFDPSAIVVGAQYL
jgi:hypothetical protein